MSSRFSFSGKFLLSADIGETSMYFETTVLIRIEYARLLFEQKIESLKKKKWHDIDENGYKNNMTIYQPEQATKNID